MRTLRCKAKQASQAVVSSGCLPEGVERETRRRSSWASMSVLQNAVDALQGILSQPSKPKLQQFHSLEPVVTSPSETGAVVLATPRPTRPATAKDNTSRPVARAASRSMATTPLTESCVFSPSLSTMPEREPRPPSAAKARRLSGAPSKALAAPAQLPPVSPPRKGKAPAPRPAALFVASAMDLDLETHLCKRTDTPPQQKWQSLSVGAQRASKSVIAVALPSIVGGRTAMSTSSCVKSTSKMRTGSVGATLWGRSSANVNMETEWNNNPLLIAF